MTENEKRKEGDDLMTCFVIHVSLLSLHITQNQQTKNVCADLFCIVLYCIVIK